MPQTFQQAGSASNYTIGGVRAWFNRLADESTTPKKFEGFRDLGNVVEAPQESESEEIEHFTAKTGTRKLDRKVQSDISESITLTLDEPDMENLRQFFRAGDVTDVVASSGNAVTDEVLKLDREDVVILEKGLEATAVVVEPFGGGAPFTLTTDYLIVEVLSSRGKSWKGISRVASGTIGDGDFVEVDYTFDITVHRSFSPQTSVNIEGKLLLFGISDTGNEFIRSIAKVQIAPDGAFDLDDEDFSVFNLIVTILDNTDDNPAFPFGVFEHYGVGAELA